MATAVRGISAYGTSGKALGKLFIARPDRAGRYVLNRKKPSGARPSTNMAASKVYANTLDQAARLLATDEYLINLTSQDGARALREYKKVKIERATI